MLCSNCFEEYEGNTCPHCGYDPATDEGKNPHALKAGTILNGKYILGKVIGQGGFGITYLAQNYETKELLAIKEYFPEDYCSRTENCTVAAFTTETANDNFTFGKEKFLDEAKTLSQFIGNKNIVRICSYFEENGTAYLVMEYVAGVGLDKYMTNHGGKLSVEEASTLLMPIADALEYVHSKGVVHRDIAPDNIIITADGTAKLIDFGAARYSTGEKTKSLDVILKHGFAPREQYSRHGKQGAYTDLYAFAATYYYAITGRIPPDSIDRIDEDALIDPSTLGVKIGDSAEEALIKALSVNAADRFQTVGEFKKAFLGQQTPPEVTSLKTDGKPELPENTSEIIQTKPESPNNIPEKTQGQTESSKKKWMIPLAVAVLVCIICAAAILPKQNNKNSDTTASAKENNETSAASNAGLLIGNADRDDERSKINIPMGTIVLFGAYEQDNDLNNGKEAIEWIVLDKEDDKLLLISRYGLDCKIYNPNRVATTWEDSEMREWLNSTFADSAFTAAERSSIANTSLTNKNNPEYGTAGGNDTKDQVFLLSAEEAENYLQSGDIGKCVSTKYAMARGNFTTPTSSHCYFWLRTPGANPWDAMIVRDQGEIDYAGAGVYEKAISIRPAIWVVGSALE